MHYSNAAAVDDDVNLMLVVLLMIAAFCLQNPNLRVFKIVFLIGFFSSCFFVDVRRKNSFKKLLFVLRKSRNLTVKIIIAIVAWRINWHIGARP